ncbi:MULTISPECIES: hypothetical protein [Pseudoalteromonas]|uniref:Uncharacterized protein n=1 Tax=Pseudoalteromonas luteoviolacea (strain 2ta16) TaxID=1353533 RepID=V4HZ45_PSEL2|nr:MULTISPECIES: hypothetical protein [Pseudoalteromonas]ESP95068.1 hypothetical protein PL2TA16_04624 [Pseudoalteromonas luteoviolacea 2ta16]KZN34177.1 hypothetical protein N483_25530 [Pseudoalteromonas luteoviolacea NCIMB 1944]MCG7549208.1 hypothetical protein [Pseudoalteromonas sp. Of7M-16]
MKDDKPTPKKHSPTEIANQVQQALKQNGNRSNAAGAFVLDGDTIKPGASK